MREAPALHTQTFGPYKNALAGKDAVIVATGPTLNSFVPMSNVVYIGVNAALFYDKITLDYYFVSDWRAIKKDDARVAASPVKKFYAISVHDNEPRNTLIPESVAIRHQASRYYIRHGLADLHSALYQKSVPLPYDITANPLVDFGSVIFGPIQFALWGNPKRIFLVGCDCARAGHFNTDEKFLSNIDNMLFGWEKVKEFRDMWYPETEIISINPVGLKGLFDKDIYVNENNAAQVYSELG